MAMSSIQAAAVEPQVHAAAEVAVLERHAVEAAGEAEVEQHVVDAEILPHPAGEAAAVDESEAAGDGSARVEVADRHHDPVERYAVARHVLRAQRAALEVDAGEPRASGARWWVVAV